MPTIVNSTPTTTALPRQWFWVELKASWSDDWFAVPYLTPVRCVDAVAPEIPTAELQFTFGYNKRENSTSFAWEAPISIRDYYCRIMLANDGEEAGPVWHGIIVDDETISEQPSAASGSQRFHAVGLAHLYDRVTIKSARVLSDKTAYEIDWVPRFNRTDRRGKERVGNRSESLGPDGVYCFSRDVEQWTAKQILDYLIFYHAPANLPFTLVDSGALADLYPTIELEGATLWSAINLICDRRRGIGAHFGVDANDAITLRTFSTAEREYRVGEASLPANPNQLVFTVPTDLPYRHMVGSVPIRASSTSQLDRITVRGERVVAIGTFSVDDGTLEKGWDEDLETEYLEGAGDEDLEQDDRMRSEDRFEGVFARLQVPEDWVGDVGDGEGGNKSPLSMVGNPDGTFSRTPAFTWIGDRRFRRSIPLDAQRRYDESPVTDNRADDKRQDDRPILAFYKHAADSPIAEADFKWRWLHSLRESLPGAHSASVRPADDGLGFEIHCSPQHLFAWDEWDEDAHFSSFPALLRWDNIAITAALDVDQRPTIVVDIGAQAGDVLRELLIDVPGAEYWYVAPGTIVDVDGETGAARRIHGDNLVLRDDRATLEAFAAAAKAWYSTRRQAVQIPMRRLGLFAPLGAILLSIDGVYGREPVNTPITGRAIDFSALTTVIETSFTALDFVAVRNGRSSGRAAAPPPRPAAKYQFA